MNAPADPNITEVIRLDDDALPELRTIVERTRAELTSPTVTLACSHMAPLLAAGGVASACAAHPQGGIRCPSCADLHTRRHTRDFEHQCDRCGAIDNNITGLFAHVAIITMVTELAGDRYLYLGPVLVGGLGVCTDCATAADLPEVPS